MSNPASLARELKVAQDGARQLALFTDRYPGFDLDSAYEVSRLVHEARLGEGARSVGRKIGFTNPDMWAIYGVRAPIWAHVYDTTVVRLEGTSASCPLSRFSEPKIEPEIVFGFRSPPSQGKGLRGVLEALEWVAHGFEIVQSHFPGWKFRAPDAVADCSLHGTLFVGPPRPATGLEGDLAALLESFTLDLSRDGQTVERGRGSNVLGSPLEAIDHLVSVLAGQAWAAPIGAGELVTTGTITTAQPVRPGEKWRTELRGIALPGLELRFVP
jgi:2-keto-4-pentenoate hydratase